MSESDSTRLPDAPNILPKGDVSGRPPELSAASWFGKRRGQGLKELGSRIREFAKRLRRDYGPEIAADPSDFKRKVKRLLGRYLPPGPGRPRKELVTLARKLEGQGVPWPEIYRRCIPNSASLRWEERRRESARLRNAVRARRRLEGKRAPRKNRKGDFSRQKNPAPFICARPAR